MGRLYMRARSRYWWADYIDHEGERQRVTTGTTDIDEARRFLKIREGAVAKGEPILPRQDRVTFAELRDNLLTLYKTTGKYKDLGEANGRIAHLTKAFGRHRAVQITPAVIRSYAEARLAEAKPAPVNTKNNEALRKERPLVTPGTVNRELAMLRRMLRLGARDGLLARVPHVEMLREAPARSGFVDEAQYRALMGALAPREDLQCVVALAYTFGWRVRSEVLTLEKRQLDMQRGTIRLDAGTTKNREGRVVYLTPALRQMLAAQLARVEALQKALKRVIPFVFPHRVKKGARAGTRIAEFRKVWRSACRAAGLPGLLVHDLRRSAVRNMERAGVARSVAMKLTGHKTESVYRRYAIVSDADLREASARLSGSPAPNGTLSRHTRPKNRNAVR